MATTATTALNDIARQVDEIRTELRSERLTALAAAVAGGFLLARLVRR